MKLNHYESVIQQFHFVCSSNVERILIRIWLKCFILKMSENSKEKHQLLDKLTLWPKKQCFHLKLLFRRTNMFLMHEILICEFFFDIFWVKFCQILRTIRQVFICKWENEKNKLRFVWEQKVPQKINHINFKRMLGIF